MKIGEKKLSPPAPIAETIYRADGDIVFLCGPVLDYSQFEKYCPQPKAPLSTNIATGEQVRKFDDKRYNASFELWADMRVNWMIINSLLATPDLQWETVKLDDPETWANYATELKAFLTEAEFYRVKNTAVEANAPTKRRREEAMKNFTSTQVQKEEMSGNQKETNSQQEEPISTPSSEPVSV